MAKTNEYRDWIFSLALSLLAILYVIFYINFIDTGLDFISHTKLSEIIFRDDFMQRIKDMPAVSEGGAPIAALAFPVYHILQNLVSKILNIDLELSASIVVTSTIILSVLTNRYICRSVVKSNTAISYYAIDIICIGSVIFMTARCFLNEWRYYMYQAAPNPIHNPTILVARPIGYICLFLFANYLTKNFDKDKSKTKTLLLFSAMCFMATIAKPSYTIVFLPAMGIATLIYMIRNRNISCAIGLLLAVVPTLITLLLQQYWVLASSPLLRTSFSWGGYAELNTWQVLGSSLVTFPVVIIGFSMKRMRENYLYQVSIIGLIIGWLQMFLLSEGGAGNYAWGYDLAVQFSTLVTLVFLLKELKEKGKIAIIKTILCFMVYGYQVYVGIQYLALIYAGESFYM